MGMEALTALVAVVLAVSVVTERLVLLIRTPDTMFGVIPVGRWLNNEEGEANNRFGSRKLSVQLLAFACAAFAAGWLPDPEGWSLVGKLEFGGQMIPAWMIAVLATGGSSFWKNILGYTKAVRDVKKAAVKAAKQA